MISKVFSKWVKSYVLLLFILYVILVFPQILYTIVCFQLYWFSGFYGGLFIYFTHYSYFIISIIMLSFFFLLVCCSFGLNWFLIFQHLLLWLLVTSNDNNYHIYYKFIRFMKLKCYYIGTNRFGFEHVLYFSFPRQFPYQCLALE